MKKTGELAGAGQAGDRGGALLPRSAASPAREPPGGPNGMAAEVTPAPGSVMGWTIRHARHAAAMVKQDRNPAARVCESIGPDCFLALASGWLNLGLGEGPGSGSEAEAACRRMVRALALALPAGGTILDVGNGLATQDPLIAESGHVLQAVLVPMGEVLARRHEFPQAQRVVVVCRSGGRSAAITGTLRAHGYDAVDLTGGMCAWTAAGLPVVTEAGAADSSAVWRQALEQGMVVHRAGAGDDSASSTTRRVTGMMAAR
jgi:rhodanese-related sulfurtransferase